MTELTPQQKFDNINLQHIYEEICDVIEGEEPHLVMPALVQVMAAVLHQCQARDSNLDNACAMITKQLREAHASLCAREQDEATLLVICVQGDT